MPESATAHPSSVCAASEALIARADSLVYTDEMERTRVWIEAGLRVSLDRYRPQTFRELIDEFPEGGSIVAEIVQNANGLQPDWSRGSVGDCYIDYVVFRLREVCETCLAARTLGETLAAERSKYLIPALAQAEIQQFLDEALGDSLSEAEHLGTLQNACQGLRDAIHEVSECPRDIEQYVRDLSNICQHWRSKVRSKAEYLHRSLPALKRLASGNPDGATMELVNMAVVEKLLDNCAEARALDPNDPLNELPDRSAIRLEQLRRILAELDHEPSAAVDPEVLG